ncbi:MAG: flagellar hook-basal body complex protein FliE [Nitrospirae bacterium]|nr:flagellar hook-basal body complex protein FliE [Nitrospirota bacterium]
MAVSPIGPQLTSPHASPAPRSSPEGATFGASLTASLDQVDQSLRAADQAIAALATGKADHLHQTMIAVEKANLSFELMLQIRNKVVAAYDEISRMQM